MAQILLLNGRCACGMCFVKSWKVKALPSPRHTVHLRGSRPHRVQGVDRASDAVCHLLVRNASGMECGMPFSYCALHERLFDPHAQTWVTWPHMYAAMVQPFCDMLDAATIDAAGYMVIPTPCDRCTAIARQAVDEYIDPL